MESEYILQSDLLDIIFENRNKKYGAYAIRKFYNARLVKAFVITLSVAVVTCSLLYLEKKKVTLVIPEIETVGTQLEPPPAEKPKIPEKPKIKPPLQQAKLNTQTWVKNISITRDPVKSMLPHNLDSLVISDQTNHGDPGVRQEIVPIGSMGDGPATGKTTPVVPAPNEVRETAEVMPSFPGGMGALRKFLENNLQNPQDLDQGQTVSVKIKFVVGYDGTLKGFETLEDGGEAFNREVIRVLKKMPKWLPGKTKGENVSVYYNIPVKFQGVE